MIQRILEVKDRDSAHPLPEELKNYLGENWKAVRDEIVDALTPIVTAERGSEDRGIFVEKNCAFVPGRGVLLNDETPGDGGEEESRDEFAHVPGYGACALMETIESVLHTEYHRSDHLRATIVYGSHDLAKTVSPTKVVFPSEKKKKSPSSYFDTRMSWEEEMRASGNRYTNAPGSCFLQRAHGAISTKRSSSCSPTT